MAIQEFKLRIHEESDLYNPFDPDQEILSEDVSDYLIQQYGNMHRSAGETYRMRIISDTPIDEKKAKELIRRHCSQQMDNLKHELKVQTLKEACLAALGAVLLTIWVMLSPGHEGVGMEILSIMGWVAVWEATSILIMRRPELMYQKKTYEKASKAEIIFETADKAQKE